MGPDTYDLASLLRDSYVDLPEDDSHALIDHFVALKREGCPDTATAEWERAFRDRFEMMALQRNLKALGTFGYQTTARSNPVYMQYIPRTLALREHGARTAAAVRAAARAAGRRSSGEIVVVARPGRFGRRSSRQLLVAPGRCARPTPSACTQPAVSARAGASRQPAASSEFRIAGPVPYTGMFERAPRSPLERPAVRHIDAPLPRPAARPRSRSWRSPPTGSRRSRSSPTGRTSIWPMRPP